MNALFFDIKRFAVHDGPGIRTTFFMQGCPLSCWWCHNPESRPMEPSSDTGFRTFRLNVDELIAEAEKDRTFFEESGGGITFSGGEPTAQMEFLKIAAKSLKAKGFHIALDTTGFFPSEEAETLAQLFDLILFDIKHLNSELHQKYTGINNQLILQNLDHLIQRKAKIRLRMPFIPEINGGEEHLNQLAKLANNYSLPVDLLPYHRIAGHKYKKLRLENNMKNYSEPSEKELIIAKEIMENQKVAVNIGG